MRIRVTKEFRGRRTKEQWIRPGDYDESDPALYGLAQTLVDEKRAVWLGDDGAEIPHGGNEVPAQPVIVEQYELSDGRTVDVFTGDTPPPFPDPNDYEAWTVDDLRAEVSRRGIDLVDIDGTGANGRIVKDDLILVLMGDDSDGAG